jgi:hypothetical protein
MNAFSRRDILYFCLESLGLAGAIYIFRKSQRQNWELNSLIDFVTQSTIFSPSLLKKLLDTGHPDLYFKSIKNLETSKDTISGLAFIQGIVNSRKSINSVLDTKTKLVVSHIKTNQIYSNINDSSSIREKVYNRFINEFSLMDNNDTDKVDIINSMNVEFKDALSFIGMNKSIRDLTRSEQIMTFILYWTKLLLSLTNIR